MHHNESAGSFTRALIQMRHLAIAGGTQSAPVTSQRGAPFARCLSSWSAIFTQGHEEASATATNTGGGRKTITDISSDALFRLAAKVRGLRRLRTIILPVDPRHHVSAAFNPSHCLKPLHIVSMVLHLRGLPSSPTLLRTGCSARSAAHAWSRTQENGEHILLPRQIPIAWRGVFQCGGGQCEF